MTGRLQPLKSIIELNHDNKELLKVSAGRLKG